MSGEEGGPEIPKSTPEQTEGEPEKATTPSFEEKIKGLIEPLEEGKESAIANESLQRLAKLATQSRNQTPEKLEEFLKKGDEWFADGQVPEEEWAILAGLISERLVELQLAQFKPEEKIEVEKPEEGIKRICGMIERFKRKLGGKKNLPTPEIEEAVGDFKKLAEAYREMGAGGLMSGMERPPGVEKGVDKLREWFEDKIHALIMEYPDQSFETNWTLVYPLQQAINSLWPKEGEKDKDIIRNEQGKPQTNEKGEPYTYSGLRKELALELESHRNLHNYMFLHRRVGGVDGIVPASTLLESRYLECLMNKPEVANALKKLERLGEVYKESKDRVFKGGLTKVEEAEEKSNQNRIFNEMSNFQREDWAGIVAGGLYSALHEAARHDVIFNESGDFFLSRVFNMPDRVKDLWEDKWHRDPAPNFYNALDLRVSGFWRIILKEQYNFFKMQIELEGLKKGDEEIKKEATKRFKEFCEQFTIAPTKEIPTTKKGDYFFIKEGYYSLKDADFEHIKLVGEKKENCLGTKTDEVKVVDLNLMDADEIRKLILNPGRLVERPGLDLIKEIWRPFKHLKGEKRSRWFRGVIKQIILLFKDKIAPDIETLPEVARRCPAKKIYPGVSAWLNPQIVLAVENLAPPLTKKDADDLLKDVVGPKPVREAKEYGKAAISAAGAMISEFAKALLGLNK